MGGRVDRTGGGQTGGQTLLHIQLWYLFSSYKSPKTVTVTTLLCVLSVALWDISLYLVEWRTCAVIRLSDRHNSRCSPPDYLFTLGRLTNNMTLIPPPHTAGGIRRDGEGQQLPHKAGGTRCRREERMQAGDGERRFVRVPVTSVNRLCRNPDITWW